MPTKVVFFSGAAELQKPCCRGNTGDARDPADFGWSWKTPGGSKSGLSEEDERERESRLLLLRLSSLQWLRSSFDDGSE